MQNSRNPAAQFSSCRRSDREQTFPSTRCLLRFVPFLQGWHAHGSVFLAVTYKEKFLRLSTIMGHLQRDGRTDAPDAGHRILHNLLKEQRVSRHHKPGSQRPVPADDLNLRTMLATAERRSSGCQMMCRPERG